ncbi:hypothetical protein J437_LFUL001151 [Ladona fulva]|uniref:Protein kinase domain-containing protein n=1 Tax=Ladona fulva TaxID=123851 RepID=A0A8K0NY42_LADFU|nr:hypothetical protein J437_LFUL001151 [Ladona fulva]
MSNETKSSGSCIPELLGFNNFLRRNSRSRSVRSINYSKTAWPVSYIESIFFPEFKRKSQVTDCEFKVVETISKGAFGKVYKVIDDGGTEYALKILSKAQIIGDNALKQVKDEVRIQSMCGHHPFIVSCPYYWQSKKQLFIVTSYIPGGELLKLWYTYGSFPENVVRIFIAEIALALDFLHNAGVIYRDLKLENILLDHEGHIQIIDFGLAKWLKYGSRTNTICGTLQYMGDNALKQVKDEVRIQSMCGHHPFIVSCPYYWQSKKQLFIAPEILRMESYTHSVDWWSLGVIAFCLLQGSVSTDYSLPI